MPKKEKMNFVFTDIPTNERGFTMVEALLTISVLLVTLPFIGYLVKGVDNTSNYDQLATQQFFYFLRDEVIQSADITVGPSRIMLQQQNGATASIEKNGNRIVRKVDGKGFEILYQPVRDIRFTLAPYSVKVSIITTDGDHYEKDINVYR
ncbi:hypothetical protein EU245_00430 [Lentibacillus lipolyticus]|nr:hypothetical protein EU245_00430 [Lentibacillus lipolyticus]